MRIAFAGSTTFSLPSLTALAGGPHELAWVLTAAERRGDRGRPAERPVRDLAQCLRLPVLQPERADARALTAAGAGDADLLIVCAYGQLLSDSVLALFHHGAWGVHPSLLPRHRGASPVASAILAGDVETGVSIYQMERRLDAGPVLAQVSAGVPPRATTPALTEMLASKAADLLLRTLESFTAGELEPRSQDEALATYAPKVTRGSGAVSWRMPAITIDRAVRALQPWPGTRADLCGSPVKLLSGEVMAPRADIADAAPGDLLGIRDNAVAIATGAGAYLLQKLQPPGSRPMSALAFLHGRRVSPPVLPL